MRSLNRSLALALMLMGVWPSTVRAGTDDIPHRGGASLFQSQSMPLTSKPMGLKEAFKNSTAPGWMFNGANLTGGSLDLEGEGWLRLTSDKPDQAGTAIYTLPFPSRTGIQIVFEYAAYQDKDENREQGDGFSVYLIDGATAASTLGAPGGSLGYSRNTRKDAIAGVTDGYLGIGFDAFGNFGTASYGDCNMTIPCPGAKMPNTVTIRGSGSLRDGFTYLTQEKAPTTIATGSRDRAYRVRIRITPAPDVTVSVEMDTNTGAGFKPLITDFRVWDKPGQIDIPPTFKLGFSASTGDASNIHEIRSLAVSDIHGVSFCSSDSACDAGQVCDVKQGLCVTAPPAYDFSGYGCTVGPRGASKAHDLGCLALLGSLVLLLGSRRRQRLNSTEHSAST